jgi:hypothetical protein
MTPSQHAGIGLNLACAGAAVPASRAGGSLLIAAVLARPLPVAVIKRVTEPGRRQNASKCHQQGDDKRCPQDHRVYRQRHQARSQTSRLSHAGSVSRNPSEPARPDRVRPGARTLGTGQ